MATTLEEKTRAAGVGLTMFIGAAINTRGLWPLRRDGLEWSGVLPTSYVSEGGGLRVLPVALGFPEVATRLLLVFSALGSIVAVSLFISRMRDSLGAAQQRVLVFGWHLQQILPATPSTKPS